MERTKPPPIRPLPLHFAKVVEERRRSRLDRARHLAANTEYQRAVLDTTEQYMLASRREQNDILLKTSLGPAVARVVHDVNMAHTRDQQAHAQRRADAQNAAADRRATREASIRADNARVDTALAAGPHINSWPHMTDAANHLGFDTRRLLPSGPRARFPTASHGQTRLR
jgi:hypothetical protein